MLSQILINIVVVIAIFVGIWIILGYIGDRWEERKKRRVMGKDGFNEGTE